MTPRAWLDDAAGKMKHFSQPQDKKLAVLGLVALLALPDAALPPEIKPGMPQVRAAISLCSFVCVGTCMSVFSGGRSAPQHPPASSFLPSS